MRIGLSFAEYVELRLKPPAGADQAFHQAAKEEGERMFPMTTVQAAGHLRSRGYDVRPPMLDLLVENGLRLPLLLRELFPADLPPAVVA